MSKLLLPFFTVPQNTIMVIERFGRFARKAESGFKFKVPLVEAVAYHHSLKEQVLDIDSQTAITRDNVKIKIDGVLYYRITDPFKASYEIDNPIHAMTMLAQTSMRSEIGRLQLDRTFAEKDNLNVSIKHALNEAGDKWGLEVLRYEIKDIKPPEQIRRSMELQAESERIKRQKILMSEGERQSEINKAEGFKESQILEGQGKAQTILQEARSVVETLRNIGGSLQREDGKTSDEALRLRLTEQYVQAMHEIYKESSIVTLPAAVEGEMNSGSPSSAAIATAFALYKNVAGSESFMPTQTPSGQAMNVDSDTVKKLLEQVQNLERGAASKGDQKKIRYLDDKALWA